ncbi:MAG: pseudouridine synthase [Marvinbryantia sp.]|jgi:16S rRNA pseudouridine516 synthase
MEKMRLDKLLATAGTGTRSEVKGLIRKGQVTVNGEICKKADEKVDVDTDRVTVNGKEVSYSKYEYHLLYKPAGCVSATKDNVHQTVLDYISSDRKGELFPVGRLDLDTEGLLLITNDGELAHQLLSPGRHVPKTYYAKINGKVTQEDAEVFTRGIDIGEEKPTLPAVLRILTAGEVSEIELTICEGKFHQVKRMFHAIGKEVTYLKRISMGSLVLDKTLPVGGSRRLTKTEIEELKKRST